MAIFLQRKWTCILLFALMELLGIGMGQPYAMDLEDMNNSRRVDWGAAGYPGQIPQLNENIVTVMNRGTAGGGVTEYSAAVQAVIDAAVDPSVIYFPAGVYRFESALLLKSGVVLHGAGSNATWDRYDNIAQGTSQDIILHGNNVHGTVACNGT